MTHDREKGQAILIAVVAMSIFLIGAIGLAVDGAQIYAHRQMAQAAADSAAQAGIKSIFDGTNTTGAAAFATTASFTCAASDARTPCVYARLNGFNGTGTLGTGVDVDFPTSAPGVSLAAIGAGTPVNLIRVTVQRTLNTGLIRLLYGGGSSTSPVKAIAMAAIVDVVAPVPILVTHPKLPGSFNVSGTGSAPKIKICGGPARSIQVNSQDSGSITSSGNPIVDLSHAGPNDPGNCTTGTGSDFGNSGGPSPFPAILQLGTTGKYLQPASPILDPLAPPVVTAPPVPVNVSPMGTKAALANGAGGCPVAPAQPCQLYSPGLWATGIKVKNETGVFKPGIYYITGGGFKNDANGEMLMATGYTDSGLGTTGTGWTGNILVYNSGVGTFDVGSNSNATLVGSPPGSAYKGILFFQDHATTVAQTHSLGGGGNLTLTGTLYFTNLLADMKTTPGVYQTLHFQGNTGSSTYLSGEIIANALTLSGTPGITMNLNSNATLNIRQMALVK